MLLELAWRNLWRQPRRSVLSLVSIVLACVVAVFLLSLQRGAYGTMKENVLRLIDGFAQVQPAGYAEDPDLRKTIDDPAALGARLVKARGVTAAAPRAAAYVILANGERSYGAAALGVDPDKERKVSSLAATIVRGRYLTREDDDAVVIGQGLARNLKIAPGGRLTLLGEARDGSVAADVLRVVGVFSTGAAQADRQLVELPLARFQADFAMDGRVNLIVLAGAHLGDVQASLPELRRIARPDGLVVRGWAELEPALNDVIILDASFSVLLYVSLVVLVVFIILNTLLMSVLERTREFGMLLAIGMRPAQIGRMVWIELLILAGGGAALGAAIGVALTAWTAIHGIAFSGAEALFSQWHMPSTLYPRLDPVSALAGPLAIAAAIALAGTGPFARVMRLKAVPAMRAA